MRNAWVVGIGLTCGLIGFLLGSRGGGESARPPSPKGAAAVVSWDGGSLTVEDVDLAFAQFGPQGRARFREEGARRQFVLELARTALLADQARRLGIDKNPEVLMRHREALSAQFVKDRFEATAGAEPTEEEIRGWYDAHRETYSQPEVIRLASIFLGAEASAPARRTQRLAEAKALLSTLLKQSATDFYAFSNLAHAKSEDVVTRGAGGELPPMSRSQLRERFGPAFEGAVSSLADGAIATSVIETEEGFHLVRLLESRAASEAPYGQVREGIAQQLRGRGKDAAWQKFVADLEKSSGFAIDDEAVRRLSP